MESENSRYSLMVLPDPAQVARAAADWLMTLLPATAERPFSVALSGGSTPQRFYRLLAEEPYRSRIPWNQLHIFLVDERHVPHDHADSNFGMIRAALLDQVPIPAGNVHPMPTDVEPELCAARYQEDLRIFFAEGTARFDVVVLGMGPDGHTASLFPGRLPDTIGDVAAIYDSPKPPPTRLTLTLPAINRAHNLVYLVTGSDKTQALNRCLAEGVRGELPAGWVQPADGAVVWLMDQAALGRAAI